MKIPFEEFEVKQCGVDFLDTLMDMQKEIISQLPEEDILRDNTREMFVQCLTKPNYTIAAWYKGKLAAISILFFPEDDEENLAELLKTYDATGLKAANYKLCMVYPEFRGNSLQYELILKLEEHAREQGVELLCATASPKNPHSVNNMLRAGFIYDQTLNKYGFVRNLYYKKL